MSRTETSMGAGPDSFPETAWSSVLGSQARDDGEARARLNELLSAYWRPVYRYIRAGWGRTVEDAKDLTQAFVCHVIEGDVMGRYRRDAGRFRHFLKAVLRNFLSETARDLNRLKRGGGRAIVSLDVEGLDAEPADAQRATPEQLFDRQWVRDVVERSLARVKHALAEEGRVDEFRIYEAYEIAPCPEGRPTYESVALAFRLTAAEVKRRIEFVRLRLREAIRETVSGSCASAKDLREEMRELFSE